MILLQGSHDSSTGIVDIAMVGSLCKKGTYHEKLREYGMVILDECHHAASETIIGVLQEVKAKYVYGVTATPFREDGLEKINYMLLGPIRYRYTSKDRAKEQGIVHMVYPRFTRAVAPSFHSDGMHPNEAYEILRDNPDRDGQIIRDVKACIDEKRTPVVLSKYLDHAKKLYDHLKGYADRSFLLSGENSQNENRKLIRQMGDVKDTDSMLVVATGKLIGEGFDLPRLDTLIMATPVAWKGVVEQYAGRLNRDYAGKENVIIYDYVDFHIPMFERMYQKRLKTYRRIGYEIYTGEKPLGGAVDKCEENSIFGSDNYRDTFNADLLAAAKEIIISSPVITGKKVEELVEILSDAQDRGLSIKVVTWKPDLYKYGDSGYWQQLQNQMREAGFEMCLVEEHCEHYCVIDRELVWYGSMSFLGKEDAEDSMMRVHSHEIAAELMELTFGDI